MKILAVVKFNDYHAFVLDEPIKLTYEKIGGMLIGSDETGIFYNCLFYEKPVGRFKAFAGREFDLPLKDGGKYEYKETIFEFGGKNYLVSESRSGSYYSDYYYESEDWSDDSEQICDEVEKVAITKYEWVAKK